MMAIVNSNVNWKLLRVELKFSHTQEKINMWSDKCVN